MANRAKKTREPILVRTYGGAHLFDPFYINEVLAVGHFADQITIGFTGDQHATRMTPEIAERLCEYLQTLIVKARSWRER